MLRYQALLWLDHWTPACSDCTRPNSFDLSTLIESSWQKAVATLFSFVYSFVSDLIYLSSLISSYFHLFTISLVPFHHPIPLSPLFSFLSSTPFVPLFLLLHHRLQGRMILADVLALASRKISKPSVNGMNSLSPRLLVDFATLTGGIFCIFNA
jgi:hypothetical protein